MSALGQKQTFPQVGAMSALPPKADMCFALAYFCFGPKADIMQCDRYENRPRRSPIAVPRDYSMHILIYRIRLESQIAMESTHNG